MNDYRLYASLIVQHVTAIKVLFEGLTICQPAKFHTLHSKQAGSNVSPKCLGTLVFCRHYNEILNVSFYLILYNILKLLLFELNKCIKRNHEDILYSLL